MKSNQIIKKIDEYISLNIKLDGIVCDSNSYNQKEEAYLIRNKMDIIHNIIIVNIYFLQRYDLLSLKRVVEEKILDACLERDMAEQKYIQKNINATKYEPKLISISDDNSIEYDAKEGISYLVDLSGYEEKISDYEILYERTCDIYEYFECVIDDTLEITDAQNIIKNENVRKKNNKVYKYKENNKLKVN